MLDHFVSCDWGSSSFRLSLVRSSNLSTVREIKYKDLGFAQIDWDTQEKMTFLTDKVKDLCSHTDKPWPCIVSGMGSSSIGIKELPYGKLPLTLQDPKLPVCQLDHNVFLISGIASRDDVMRGEEVQAIGAALTLDNAKDKTLLILPGTHSKHVYLNSECIVSFKTYMTGELFSILGKHSILRHSIEAKEVGLDSNAFENGVKDAKKILLSQLFTIRANQLLQGKSKQYGKSYLSGLLIGNELSQVREMETQRVVLVAEEPLASRYKEAIAVVNANISVLGFPVKKATRNGQLHILKHILNES